MLDDRYDLVTRHYLGPLILARVGLILGKPFSRGGSVPERFTVQRVKRYTNREERERNPDWLSPSELRLDDSADLSELINTRQDACPKASKIEEYIKAGGELFLVRDTTNCRKSLNGKILAMVAYAIIPTFSGRVGIVCDIYLHPDDPTITSYIHEAINRHFASIDIQPLARPEILHKPIKSDISGIDRAERLEDYIASRLGDDGPPTRRILGAGKPKC